MKAIDFTLPIDFDGVASMDVEEAHSSGVLLREDYTKAAPYPHIVIDNFLPKSYVEHILNAFPVDVSDKDRIFDINYGGHHKRQIQPEGAGPEVQAIFHFFNSAPVLRFLEGLTGIDGLVPDPYFAGAGFHETSRGGKLGIHADFRINKKLACERRLNLLVYLNPEWDDNWGGLLEIWDRKMTRCEKKVSPLWNRCVVFNTDADSYHGHPDPLMCPDHIKRRSVALYYYTASKSIYYEVPDTSTLYAARPGDGADIQKEVRAYRREEFLKDWLPPVALRALNAVRRRLG